MVDRHEQHQSASTSPVTGSASAMAPRQGKTARLCSADRQQVLWDVWRSTSCAASSFYIAAPVFLLFCLSHGPYSARVSLTSGRSPVPSRPVPHACRYLMYIHPCLAPLEGNSPVTKGILISTFVVSSVFHLRNRADTFNVSLGESSGVRREG